MLNKSKDPFIDKKIRKSNKVFIKKDHKDTLVKCKKFKLITKDFNKTLDFEYFFFVKSLKLFESKSFNEINDFNEFKLYKT